jgi:hypothetical protein
MKAFVTVFSSVVSTIGSQLSWRDKLFIHFQKRATTKPTVSLHTNTSNNTPIGMIGYSTVITMLARILGQPSYVQFLAWIALNPTCIFESESCWNIHLYCLQYNFWFLTKSRQLMTETLDGHVYKDSLRDRKGCTLQCFYGKNYVKNHDQSPVNAKLHKTSTKSCMGMGWQDIITKPQSTQT